MGKIGVFVVFSSLLVVTHNIFESHVYAVNQDKVGIASPGDKMNGSDSPHANKLFNMITNGSYRNQESSDKDALKPDAGAIFNVNASHKMSMQSIYGFQVTSDVYGFSIDEDELSAIFVQINNPGDGKPWSLNAINVGWHVFPDLYGDSKTHFYVCWTSDGYEKTGCYNLECPGYIPEANVPLLPGPTINAVSDPDGVKRTIIFKVFKDGTTGDWLVHLGFDSEPYLIGRFPKSIFTSMADEAHEIQFAGVVATRTTHLVPMGSGFLSSSTKAASFSDIQVIDQNGKASLVQQDMPAFMSDENIYSVSSVGPNGKFTYGGPLG